MARQRAAAAPAVVHPEIIRRGELVERVLSTQAQMYAQRGNFNVLWQTVAERLLPNYSDFTMVWAEGQRRTNKVFDSTANLALDHFRAALESMLCPHSMRWHGLRTSDPKYWGDVVIEQWLDDVTDCLFRARYAPQQVNGTMFALSINTTMPSSPARVTSVRTRGSAASKCWVCGWILSIFTPFAAIRSSSVTAAALSP